MLVLQGHILMSALVCTIVYINIFVRIKPNVVAFALNRMYRSNEQAQIIRG